MSEGFIKWSIKNKKNINNVLDDCLLDVFKETIEKSNYSDIINKLLKRNHENKDKDFICVHCKKVFKWNYIIEDKDEWICGDCCEKKYDMIPECFDCKIRTNYVNYFKGEFYCKKCYEVIKR